MNNLKCIPSQNHIVADISRIVTRRSDNDTECRSSSTALFTDREFQSDFLWDHARRN
jgi:hypothetical protein